MNRLIALCVVAVVCLRCNSKDASSGDSGSADFTVSDVAAGDSHCPAGGILVTTGTTSAYICNGEDGIDGTNGINGTNGSDGAAPVIADSPASDNHCANGGVSVTTSTLTYYICNGADGTNGTDGTSFTITDVTPGVACEHGGIKVVSAAGDTHYICNGTTTGLCAPSADSAMYMHVMDETTGSVIKGSATRTGNIQDITLQGICYSRPIPTDPTSGLIVGPPQEYAPFVVFMQFDATSLAQVYAAYFHGDSLTVTIDNYVPSGGGDVKQQRIVLATASIVGMRQAPTTNGFMVEMALSYDTIDWKNLIDSTEFTETVTASFAPADLEPSACPLAAGVLPYSIYMTTTTPTITGDVTVSGLAGSIAVLADCHTIETLGGTRKHFVFDIVKAPDGASPALFDNAAQLQTFGNIRLQYWHPSSTMQVHAFDVELIHPVIADIETTTADVTDATIPYLERISFVYEDITVTTVSGGFVAEDAWR